MGWSRGKRKSETIDLTGDDDDNVQVASPQTPHPPKKARAGVPTPTSSSNNRYASQAGGSSVYQTPQSSSRSGHNAPSSSQVPSLTQSPSSLFFNDDEEVEGEGSEDFENLCLYGTIAGRLPEMREMAFIC